MTARHLIILTVFLPTVSVGQNISDSLLATFYNKTLTSYYSDLTAQDDQTKFGCVLYKTDFDTSRLVKNIGENKFKFFSSKTDERTLLHKPYKQNNGRSIYSITHKTIGQDTVDINIGKWLIESADKKTLSLNVQCGGPMGYIPNGRFIYDKTTNTWTFTAPLKEIIRQETRKK